MPDDSAPSSLEQRVAELEARVAQLEGRPAVVRPVAPIAPPHAAAPKKPARAPWDVLLETGEGWLGRAGVGLLVVGLILLFRYAVERGWLTPEMRIAIGLVLGTGLLGAGGFFFLERRRYRQILMGGGIVILFITGLAAVELYQLISGTFALAFFVVVAGTAFRIAARQEESIIASIGAVGALLPPSFLLADAVPGMTLWLYLTIIILWTGVLMAVRGWERSMLVAAAVSVLAMFHNVPDTTNVQVAAVLAIAACWVCFAALPLIRARLRTAYNVGPLSADFLLAVPPLVTLGLAFVGDQFVFRNWRAFELSAGLDAIGFALIAVWLRQFRHADTASRSLTFRGEAYRVDSFSAAACASVLSFALAGSAAFDAPWQFVAVAAVAAAAAWLRAPIGVELLRPVAHALFAVLALAFVLSLERFSDSTAFDSYAISFAIVGAIAAVAAFRFARADERMTYFIGVFIAAHVLLATELAAVQSAPWLASASYAAVGSTLLIAGLMQRKLTLQRAGMVSLALLLARLFLYDLAQVDVGVRIVLFLASGFAFLGLSYLVRSRRFA